MRHEKASALLGLARKLASSAEGLTLDQIAAEMGVGRRTAERMRDALDDLFPQMQVISDGPTKRFKIPGGLDGFFQNPTTEELLELSKAYTALQMAGAAPRAKALEDLEHKIRAAMRAPALRRLATDVEALVRAETIAVQAGPRPFEDETLIATIRQAIMAMKALRFTYAGGRTPGATRTVTPYGLMFGRANYLVAAEDGVGEARNWRLDRIGDIEISETPASAPETFSLRDYANRSFGIYQDDVENVVLKILPSGAADGLSWRFHPSQTTEPQSDGSLIVRFQASGMRELAWHLFTWEDKVQILSPPRLQALMVTELQNALAAHQAQNNTTETVAPAR